MVDYTIWRQEISLGPSQPSRERSQMLPAPLSPPYLPGLPRSHRIQYTFIHIADVKEFNHVTCLLPFLYILVYISFLLSLPRFPLVCTHVNFLCLCLYSVHTYPIIHSFFFPYCFPSLSPEPVLYRISPLLISVGKRVLNQKMRSHLGPPSAVPFFLFSLMPCISD